jgi:hypothetical protein
LWFAFFKYVITVMAAIANTRKIVIDGNSATEGEGVAFRVCEGDGVAASAMWKVTVVVNRKVSAMSRAETVKLCGPTKSPVNVPFQ